MSSEPRFPLATADRATRREHQRRRLHALLEQLLASNPYYRDHLSAAGVHRLEGLTSLEALRDLPFTTREMLLADQAAHPPFGSNLTFPLDAYSRYHRTSGNSGPPLRWLDTADSWQWWADCWLQGYHAAGLGPDDRLYFPFSFGPFAVFWSGWAGAERLGALLLSGGSLDGRQRLRALVELEATALVTTPSYALHLLEIAAREGIDPRESAVRRLVVAGEPGGSQPFTRARLESGWDAVLFDLASATEVGAYAFACEERAGLHLNEAEFVAEVVDPDQGTPTDEGELVLTSLGRLGSPVLRYRTGDHVRLAERPCACGRTFALLEGGILGRFDDRIIVRGINLFPSAIENVVRHHPESGEFIVEVSRPDGIDLLRLLVELDERNADRVATAIGQEIADQLLLDARVVPVSPGTLPHWETRARRVRDLRDR